MPAAKLDLTGSLRLEQGASYALTLQLSDAAGSPFDLTGYTVLWRWNSCLYGMCRP